MAAQLKDLCVPGVLRGYVLRRFDEEALRSHVVTIARGDRGHEGGAVKSIGGEVQVAEEDRSFLRQGSDLLRLVPLRRS